MGNINIEQIYNFYIEEIDKYNYYIDNKEVDFLAFYKCFRDAFTKHVQESAAEAHFTIPMHIQLEELQGIFDTMKQSGIEYYYCNCAFRIEEK